MLKFAMLIIQDMHLKLILFILSISLPVLGQNTNVQLAFQYYQGKEFEKAAVLFEDLFNETNAQVYLSYAINSLIEIKDFQKAEKMINRQIRKNKNELQNYIELGYLYKTMGKLSEANDQFTHVIKNLPADRNTISLLANSFLSKKEYDFAGQCYEKGRKLLPYGFHSEMANVYAFQRRSQEMIDEYLDLLEEDPAQMEYVQNNVQSRMVGLFDENLKEIFKKSLIKRIQKETNTFIYSEMLVWYYMQENDFGNAIIQAKALDKRRREGGMRLIELGSIALSNNMYFEAADAYSYVLKYGENSPYYIEAKLGYLEVIYQQVIIGQINGEEEYKKVEDQFVKTIKELEYQTTTIRILKDLAHLKAFYLGKSDEAIEILKNAIENERMDAAFKGACKIELGDIYLLKNLVSDAILEYAQAAKLNENNDLGDKAKFKRATLAFYTGNFEWAQAQLQVLKEGTSKLIANDAFQLSMLIEDNTGLDSAETAMRYYARAEMCLQQNKKEEAIKLLDTLDNNFQTDGLIDDVLFLKSKIFESDGNIDKTITCLEKIANSYGSGLLGDDAVYKLACIYDYQLEDKKKASEFYKKMIFDYPGSIFVTESRKRFRILRGDKVEQ
ncbi:MAG: hypothetical protein U0W24_06390 [Bacteroidales bacterium]